LYTLVIAALVAPAVMGADTPAPSPKPKKTPKVHMVIGSVDANSITVKEGDKTTTYKITPQTEITFKGNTATVADLKAGMRVDVTASTDQSVADRIAANDPPKEK
jgi:hypothetical protein